MKTEISDSRVKQLDGVFPITGRKGGESSLSEEDLFDAESSLEETRSTKPNPLNVMSSTLNKDADDCIAPTPPGSNKKTVKVDSDRNSVTSDSSRSPKCVRDNQTCDTKLLLTNSSSLIDITNGCPKLEAGAREGDQSRCKFEKGEENVSDIKLITENSSVKIVDINVCVKNPNFKEFVQGWRTKSKFSLCFAGTKKPQQDSNQVHIGSKFTNGIFQVLFLKFKFFCFFSLEAIMYLWIKT